jgi:hypothetical protein
MPTSSSGTAAAAVDGWDVEVVAGFGVDAGTVGDAAGGGVRIGSGVQVDTCNGTVGVVRGLAGTESSGGVTDLEATESDSFRSALTTGLVSSARLGLGVDAEDELGGVACVGAGGAVLGLAATESSNIFRSVLSTGVVDSTGLGVDAVDAGDELGSVDCAEGGGGVSVLTEPEAGVATGDEVVACAGIGDVVPTLAGPGSGGSARVEGTATGGGDTVGLRLGVDADADAAGELGTIGCAGLGDVVPTLAGPESSGSARVEGTAAGGGDTVGLRLGVGVDAAGELGTVGCAGSSDGVVIAVGAGTGDVGSVLAGRTESGNTVRGALGVGIGVSAGTRIEVETGDVRGTVTCSGGGAAPVLTGAASGITAGDRVPVAADAGPGGADSVLAGGTGAGNTVRVDDGGAEPELVVCAAGCRAVSALLEAESGGDVRVVVTAALCPTAGLGVDAEGELEGVACLATGRVVPACAEGESWVVARDGGEIVVRT